MNTQENKDEALFIETENGDEVTREMLKTKNRRMKWQVGRRASRTMRLPVYIKNRQPPVVSHHVDGNCEVKLFHILGFGETLIEAREMAALKLLGA